MVDILVERHVPLVLGTGYDASGIPHAYAHLLRREKPARARELVRTLAKVLDDTACV